MGKNIGSQLDIQQTWYNNSKKSQTCAAGSFR